MEINSVLLLSENNNFRQALRLYLLIETEIYSQKLETEAPYPFRLLHSPKVMKQG